MDFMKFWRVVEMYPWFLRVLPSFFAEEVTKPITGLDEIVRFLGPTAVQQSIGYIAFRPWANLDRGAKHVCLHSRMDENGRFESHTSGVYFRCLWHREGEERFSSVMDNNGPQDLTVGQLLGNIYEECGSVDVVAKVIFTSSETGKKSRNSNTPEDILTELIFSEDKNVSSYELFIPKYL